MLTAVPGGEGHLRAKVRGRRDEVFHCPGATLHPHVVRSTLVRRPEVAEYQVRQTPRGLAVTVVPAVDAVDEEGLAAALATALAGAGLPDPQVAVASAPALDRDPRTGKLRRFVPLPRALDPES